MLLELLTVNTDSNGYTAKPVDFKFSNKAWHLIGT